MEQQMEQRDDALLDYEVRLSFIKTMIERGDFKEAQAQGASLLAELEATPEVRLYVEFQALGERLQDNVEDLLELIGEAERRLIDRRS